ncbi:MAG: hypothetical protein KDJ44_14295 [Rhodoblastus sp.]|nr:hypothetical protein [Rhodoblastus sp.]
MRDPYLALDNEAPEAPLDGLLRAVRRTCATINEETVALESGAAADYGEFRHRKDLCLLELSRRAPALVNPPRDPELNAALHDLKDAIIRNQKTLRCHVNAARQVSAIIMKSMAEEDSDHTYSTRAAGKRPPA